MKTTRRILLIDDEEVILFGFSKFLKEPGVIIDCASTEGEAEHCINSQQYNGAIVDLSLSNSAKKEGYELVKLIRLSQKACRIIVLTAFGDDSVRLTVKNLGADLFCEKPMEPEELKKSLVQLGVYG